MKTRLLLAILTCMLSRTAFSQPLCSFDVNHNKRMQKSPVYRLAVEETEKKVQQFIAQNRRALSARTTGTAAVLYTIPVVVHVIHTGDPVGTVYNPSDAQIQDAISYLNEVYSGTYPGTEGIGDMQLQFALAQRGPNCQSASGINRINASAVPGYTAGGISMDPGITPGVDEILIKDLSRWSAPHYYNIWIVNKIDGADGTVGTFTAGYAYFPGVPGDYDGTVMLATQMKRGRNTLPHEMGHAFGLYHTFQDSQYNTSCPSNTDCTNGGDKVCDTDPVSLNYDTTTKAYNFSCRTGNNLCTNTPYTPNTERNYMGYTTCNTLFTAGQKARVLAYANSAFRKSLSTSFAVNPVYPFAFSTPVPTSCAPVTSDDGLNSNSAGILNIELNQRNLGSSIAAYDYGYVDGTSSCLNLVQLTAGSTYTLGVTVLGRYREQFKAWIDFNNDGIFDNATELIHSNSSIITGYTSGSFVVPPSATQSTVLRMRVMDDVSTYYAGLSPLTDACSNPSYGQAEDYPVYIVSGTLPVTLLKFEGSLKNNTALLNWNTGADQNLHSIEVEKSINGKDFLKIAVINAGQRNSMGGYSYVDGYLSDENYYRLRLLEKNKASSYSPVVVLRTTATKQGIDVVNNPFGQHLDLRLKRPAAQLKVQLVNAVGMVVAEKMLSSAQGTFRWHLAGNYTAGYYLVKAWVDGEQFVQKVIKQ